MSFGFSIGDFILLTQLANTTVQNARKACGAHDAITREVSNLHTVLRSLQSEVSKPDSILNKPGDHRTKELSKLARGCKKVLKILSQVLDKYNALSEEKRSVTKLWQKVKFGNNEMLDLGEIRLQITTYTQAITMLLNLMSIGSQGKVEKYMELHGEELREIKESLNWVTASLQANSREEGSILTSYAEDDKHVWRSFRRELIKEGFSSRVLGKHKRTIIKYILELGERGALDEIEEGDAEEIDHILSSDEDTASDNESLLEMNSQEETEEGYPEPQADKGDSFGTQSNSTGNTFDDEEKLVASSLVRCCQKDEMNDIMNVSGSKMDTNTTEDSLASPQSDNLLDIDDSKQHVDHVEDAIDISSSPSKESITKAPFPTSNDHKVQIEDTVDEDFLPETHPNCVVGGDQVYQDPSMVFPTESPHVEEVSVDDFTLDPGPKASPFKEAPLQIDRKEICPQAEVGSMLEYRLHNMLGEGLKTLPYTTESPDSDSSSTKSYPSTNFATVSSYDSRVRHARKTMKQRLASVGGKFDTVQYEVTGHDGHARFEKAFYSRREIMENVELSLLIAQSDFISPESHAAVASELNARQNEALPPWQEISAHIKREENVNGLVIFPFQEEIFRPKRVFICDGTKLYTFEGQVENEILSNAEQDRLWARCESEQEYAWKVSVREANL